MNENYKLHAEKKSHINVSTFKSDSAFKRDRANKLLADQPRDAPDDNQEVFNLEEEARPGHQTKVAKLDNEPQVLVRVNEPNIVK